MTSAAPLAYLKLKTAQARKLGRTGGHLEFLVLADPERQHLYLAIIGNQGGGYYSNEAVAFAAVEAALPLDRATHFPAKVFAPCFKGRSTNNPGFLAAILRSLGLLHPVVDKPHLHAVVGDWSDWKMSILDLEGEPYVPPTKPGLDATPSAPAFDAAEAGQAVTELPEPLRGRRKGGKLKDPEHRHPTVSPEASDHAHPA